MIKLNVSLIFDDEQFIHTKESLKAKELGVDESSPNCNFKSSFSKSKQSSIIRNDYESNTKKQK